MTRDDFLITFRRKPQRLSEIYYDPTKDQMKVVIGTAKPTEPEEIAMEFRKFADLLDSLGEWSRSEENDKGLVLSYAYMDEGKQFAGWKEPA